LLTDDQLPAHAAQVLHEQVPEVIIIPTGEPPPSSPSPPV
jgi:hypothetical protein